MNTARNHNEGQLGLDSIDYAFTAREDDPTTAGVIAKQAIGQIWPDTTDGTKLYFVSTMDPKPYDIVLAKIGDSIIVRHFEPHIDCYMLRSSNPDYADIIIDNENEFAIMGVCIAATVGNSDSIIERHEARRETVGKLRLV